jgi:hypothetical protein
MGTENGGEEMPFLENPLFHTIRPNPETGFLESFQKIKKNKGEW